MPKRVPCQRARSLVVALALLAPVTVPLVAQDLAMATRSPRFLAPSQGPTGQVEIDARTSPILRRRVSLHVTGADLRSVLRDLSGQADVKFVFNPDVVPVDRPVTLRADGITLAGALLEVLMDTDLDVLMPTSGRQLVLVKRPTPHSSARMSTGKVVGRVTDAKTGAKLFAVNVFLDDTRISAATDTAGWYQLEADSGSYTLVARRLGYTKQSRKVTVLPDRVDTVAFALEPAAVPLTDLVTTATGQQRRRDLGNAITTIRADSVLRNAPIRNLTDLLQDRVPGMTLQHTSGAPGDPARIRLRGLGSLQRSNDPVVVVDGVRVYATQSALRSGNLTNAFGVPGTSTPAPSPLDQIDPNIIETIEVFKGPSAATLYGADAANGVIVITTKKGKPGPTRWHASAEGGLTDPLGRYPTGYYRWGHSQFSGFTSLDFLCKITDRNCVQDSLVQFQALNEPRLTMLGQGQRTGLSLTASGGTQVLTYSVTGTYGDETGLLKLPDFEVDQFRARLKHDPPDWMQQPHHLKQWGVTSTIGARLGATADLSLTASLGRTQQQRTDLESQVAALAATFVDSINGRYYRAQVGNNLSPSDTTFLREYYSRITAASLTFTTGINGTWRPRSWLDFSSQVGLNVMQRTDERLLPPALLTVDDDGNLSRGSGQSLVSTFTMQGNLRRPIGRGFVFQTNAGVDLTTQSTNDLTANVSGLTPNTTNSGAITTQMAYGNANTSVFGWHIEPRLQGQRFSLSTGLRLDGGSAYGTRITGIGGGGLLALPKLNGSWVISEEPFFPFKSLFTSLRLRGAYGQAQVQPGPADRLRTYSYVLGNTPSSVQLQTLGNTQLRPERSTEFEGGFDADLLESRMSVELTGYRKTQVDALMPLTLPPSLIEGGTVLTNIGTIRNTGVELTLRVSPVQSAVLGWQSELSYSSNHNELVKLGRGVVPSYQDGIVAGYPVGGRWAKPILGYADENQDGVLEPREIVIGDSSVFMGRLYPAYQLTLHNTVTLFHGAVGVTGGLSYDAGMTQVDELGAQNWVLTRALADPSTPLNQQAAVLGYNTTKYGLTRDISTLRFNELSINYQAPVSVARFLRAQRLSLALQGRNLAMHSTYQGRDPDVNAWSPGETIVDGGQLAQPRTWQLRVDVDY